MPDCPTCLGYGRVCSAHPDLAWGPGLPNWECYLAERVCWCGAGPRPCPRCEPVVGQERTVDDHDPPPTTPRSDLKDMVKWALVAVAITLVFGLVLNVLEAVL